MSDTDDTITIMMPMHKVLNQICGVFISSILLEKDL